jgi:hypothetical protein
MLQVMRDIGGVEIPESLAKLVGEDGSKPDGKGQMATAERATTVQDRPQTKPGKPQA